jgi:hypothetical protein
VLQDTFARQNMHHYQLAPVTIRHPRNAHPKKEWELDTTVDIQTAAATYKELWNVCTAALQTCGMLHPHILPLLEGTLTACYRHMKLQHPRISGTISTRHK